MAIPHPSRQQARPAARLGSADALRIMQGRWREVWREKTGQAPPPDLDAEPSVQIGIATEALHGRFYTQRTGLACRPAGDEIGVHPQHEHLVARIDFLTWLDPPAEDSDGPEAEADPPDTILEAKFHSGHLSDEELAEQYYWQLQHQMLVAGYGQAVLSILRPSGYSFLPVAGNQGAQTLLLESLHAFWWHVENDLEPADPLAVEPPDLGHLKIIDMSQHEEFAALGGVLMRTHASVLAHREAEQRLKALMPPEARIAFLPSSPPSAAGADGGEDAPAPSGVVLIRARDGRLSLKFGDLPRKHATKAQPWQPLPAPPPGG